MEIMDIYKKALNIWGKEAQINVAIEEFAELIVELSKYKRRINGTSFIDISKEMADAEIMLEQLKIVFSNQEIVKQEKIKKLERLESSLY